MSDQGLLHRFALEHLASKQVGDDTELEYRATWADRRMRVTLSR